MNSSKSRASYSLKISSQISWNRKRHNTDYWNKTTSGRVNLTNASISNQKFKRDYEFKWKYISALQWSNDLFRLYAWVFMGVYVGGWRLGSARYGRVWGSECGWFSVYTLDINCKVIKFFLRWQRRVFYKESDATKQMTKENKSSPGFKSHRRKRRLEQKASLWDPELIRFFLDGNAFCYTDWESREYPITDARNIPLQSLDLVARKKKK